MVVSIMSDRMKGRPHLFSSRRQFWLPNEASKLPCQFRRSPAMLFGRVARPCETDINIKSR